MRFPPPLPPLLLALILVAAPFAYHEYGGALYCNTTCDDCEDALNNNSYTTVYLNSSLSSPGANCIDNPANFSNKTFDCQGNTITGDRTSSTYGIYADSSNNVTLQNCIVQSFHDGIRIYYSNNSMIFNTTSANASNDGIGFYYFSNGTFSNNTVCNISHEGMALDYSSNNLIANNTIFNSVQQSIEALSAENNTIIYNVFYNSSGGVDFHHQYGNSIGNLISNNTMYNVDDGIEIWKAVNNVIVNNTITGPYTRDDEYWWAPILFQSYGEGTSMCGNVIENNTGPGGLPIYYSNESVNWANFEAAQVLLCDADNSVVSNVTVNSTPHGSAFTLRFIFVDNLTVTSSVAEGNFFLETCTDAALINNTALNSITDGFCDEGSNGTYFSGNAAYNSNWSGFSLESGNTTLVSNTAYNSGLYGIQVREFNDFRNLVYGINSTGHTISSNMVYGNRMGGIFLASSQNATVSGNVVYSNGNNNPDPDPYYPPPDPAGDYFGIGFANAWNVTIANNTIYNNLYYGLAINNSNVTSTNDRVYGNGEAEVMAYSTSAAEICLSGMLMHSSSYPNVTITDVLEANTAYTIRQVASPSTNYPDSLTAVQNRVLNITNITGSPTIDSLTIAWGAPEENYYDESTFDLWRYVTSWVDLNASANTTSNTVNYSSVITEGAYGILGVYTYKEREESDDECDSDSDCGECEECNAGACVLPSGACLSDSDCAGEGETCSSCECIPPECVNDDYCPSGYSCKNYVCVEILQEPEQPAEPEHPPSEEPPGEQPPEGTPQEPESTPETPGNATEPEEPPTGEAGQAEVPSAQPGGAGEAPQPQKGALPSDLGFFLAVIIGAIILYFILTRIFPGLPGGKDW